MDAVDKEMKILDLAKSRLKDAMEFYGDNREDMLDDLKFLNGEHWPDSLKKEREADGRPCLVINKAPTFVDQVTGDIRQNTPSIKVKPVDSKGDPVVAEILTGLIRNIEVRSNADTAYDTAGEAAVQCGEGAFRIGTEYADDDVFDQDIVIRRIKNPFTVYWDPTSQEWDHCDAKWCHVTTMMSTEEFTDEYPDAATRSVDGKHDSTWGGKDDVRVSEYFYKEEKKQKLYLLQDSVTGAEEVTDELLEGWEVIRSRDVTTNTVKWIKMSGQEILEGPTDIPSKYIPIVTIYGKELNIEGKTIYRGVIRHAKDPMRLYNYSRSTSAEMISLAPKAPWLVTPKQIGEYKSYWDSAHKKNYPYLPYNADSNAPGPPIRNFPDMASTGLQMEIQISDQEMHDTTGLQQSSLGKTSNEKSGRAIMARQREGDVANFAYYDNLARGIKYAGKVIVDMIPKIYDTPRVLRLLGEDGKDDFVPVNQNVELPDGRTAMFDLTVGKYDVEVTIGPSYTTQREEAADSMMAFLQAFPAAAPVIGDLIAKNMDWPGAQEIEKRLKALLPPGLAGEEGQQPPPGAQEPPQDPEKVLKAQKTKAQTEGILLDNVKKKREIGMGVVGAGENTQLQ